MRDNFMQPVEGREQATPVVDFSVFGVVTRDPGYRYDAKGSGLWCALLIKAREADFDFFSRLNWLRDVGCILVKDPKFNYHLEPVIGADHWSSAEEWNSEKRCLIPFQKNLIDILQAL